jgi:RIO kinase 1
MLSRRLRLASSLARQPSTTTTRKPRQVTLIMFQDEDEEEVSYDPFESIIQSLIERALIIELLAPIKSGKEASVYRCRAHPSTGVEELALKMYRPREERSFKNDALYQEGRMLTRVGGGNTRAARAVRAGTTFGRKLRSATWSGHEAATLELLHDAGLCVPRPFDAVPGALLMELFATQEGHVAPALHQVRLQRREAAWLFDAICSDIERMLSLHVVHGDLSAYNVLVTGGEYRIIDFPQAVDPRFNPHAFTLLLRDLENIAHHCARFGPIRSPVHIAHDMWQRFRRGELG